MNFTLSKTQYLQNIKKNEEEIEIFDHLFFRKIILKILKDFYSKNSIIVLTQNI